eukprot:365612-Chlamydomonas_euryale.AAC.4
MAAGICSCAATCIRWCDELPLQHKAFQLYKTHGLLLAAIQAMLGAFCLQQSRPRRMHLPQQTAVLSAFACRTQGCAERVCRSKQLCSAPCACCSHGCARRSHNINAIFSADRKWHGSTHAEFWALLLPGPISFVVLLNLVENAHHLPELPLVQLQLLYFAILETSAAPCFGRITHDGQTHPSWSSGSNLGPVKAGIAAQANTRVEAHEQHVVVRKINLHAGKGRGEHRHHRAIAHTSKALQTSHGHRTHVNNALSKWDIAVQTCTCVTNTACEAQIYAQERAAAVQLIVPAAATTFVPRTSGLGPARATAWRLAPVIVGGDVARPMCVVGCRGIP